MARSGSTINPVIEEMTDRAKEVQATSLRAIDRCIASAQQANQEYHRYAIAGAAGGLALLASQVSELPDAAQASAVIAMLWFAHSLRCSLMTFQALWLERSKEAKLWADWGTKAVDAAFVHDNGKIAPMVWPESPRPVTELYERWSPAAIGSLTAGASVSIFTLVLSIEPELPLWLINLPHRISHWLGWV